MSFLSTGPPSNSVFAWVGANQILSDELSWTIPAAYRCPDGSVRVYLPAIDLDDPFGARRHRSFTAERIDLLGPAAVEDMLIVGLARRSTWRPHGETSSLEDIEERRRDGRFTALRRAQIPWPVSEFTTLFEEENQALTDMNRQLHARTVSLEAMRSALETDKEDLQASVEEQRRMVKSLRAALANSVMREHRLSAGLKAFQSLDVLPRTVEEVVQLAQLVFPDRLRLTERALRSAKDALINQKPAEMPAVWSLLQAMACVLHELHFARAANDTGDVTKEFESRTPFGLALTETGATKDDAELRKLRRDVYGGEPIDITPHVKLGGGAPRSSAVANERRRADELLRRRHHQRLRLRHRVVDRDQDEARVLNAIPASVHSHEHIGRAPQSDADGLSGHPASRPRWSAHPLRCLPLAMDRVPHRRPGKRSKSPRLLVDSWRIATPSSGRARGRSQRCGGGGAGARMCPRRVRTGSSTPALDRHADLRIQPFRVRLGRAQTRISRAHAVR